MNLNDNDKLILKKRILDDIEVNENRCWSWRNQKWPYPKICLRRSNKKFVFCVHRLAYEFFFQKIPPGLKALHKCDNPWCVNPYHLFIGTPKDNTQDMIKKGRHYLQRFHGPRVPMNRGIGKGKYNAKLTDDQVCEIRKLREEGYSGPILSKRFGIHKKTIYGICKFERYKHIGMD